MSKGKKNNWACIILAAGIGTRMKSSIPKVLHRVAGKTLLERSIELVGSIKQIEKKIVIIGHGADKVRKRIPDGFDIVIQKPLLGTGHAVMQTVPVLKNFTGNVLILCADVPLLTTRSIKKFIEKHQRGSYDCTVMSGQIENPFGYGRICREGSTDHILKIVEEREATAEEKAIHEINSGIYCFRWPLLNAALKKLRIRPSKKEYYLTDVIEQMPNVRAFCVDETNQILGINSRDQLAKAEKVLRLRKCRELMAKGVTIVDPDTAYIDDSVEIGADSIIYPCTIIEGRVKIGRFCEIGPFSHIRDGVVLKDHVEIGNFVEVKQSQISSHVKAKHLTYIGDTQIGSNVNVGAGTITANYDGVHKHKTVIGKGTFIGSGTILVAPVNVGHDAVTGAGAVVTKGKNVPHHAVVVGVPARVLNKKGEA
ncbi:MAG: NTP transferase domain-containing protein [Chlamydiota bacterium]|nr:NTP transferase domain-containing protein [Chlamydiota bacterium]